MKIRVPSLPRTRGSAGLHTQTGATNPLSGVSAIKGFLPTAPTIRSVAHAYTEAMHRHLDVAPLNWNVTVLGSVVDPLEVVGADTVEFSVLVQPIV